MKYQFENTEVNATVNTDGTVEFRHNGIPYRSVGAATFDNSPSNNYSTYSAPLVCWNEEEKSWDDVGKVEWDIIDPKCEDESDACNWDKFSIYF